MTKINVSGVTNYHIRHTFACSIRDTYYGQCVRRYTCYSCHVRLVFTKLHLIHEDHSYGAASRLRGDRIMLLVFVVPLVTPTNACHSSSQPQCASNDAMRNISSFCQLRLQITMPKSHVDSVTGNTKPDTHIHGTQFQVNTRHVHIFNVAGKLVALMRSYKGSTLDASAG